MLMTKLGKKCYMILHNLELTLEGGTTFYANDIAGYNEVDMIFSFVWKLGGHVL
jgi:hypothetical protein